MLTIVCARVFKRGKRAWSWWRSSPAAAEEARRQVRTYLSRIGRRSFRSRTRLDQGYERGRAARAA